MKSKDPAELVLERSARNKQLAIELYCECYIYSHYDEEMKDTPPEYYPEEPKTWFDNFVYRVRSILKHHRISIEIDTSDVQEIYRHSEEIKKFAIL